MNLNIGELNLHLFNGDGAAADSAMGNESTIVNGNTEVIYGKAPQNEPTKPKAEAKESETKLTTNTKEELRGEFEKFIKNPDYKEFYDERVKQAINARFKETKALEERSRRLEALSPVLELLSSKYGVDGNDVNSLIKAIEDDSSYYEDEAYEKGLTVEQLKHIKQIERENAEFKRVAKERERQENATRIYARWQAESEKCRSIYPNFDLQNECANVETGERFLGLLKSGVDVQTAFEVVHKDDLIGGAMQYTANAIQQKTVNDIRARGMRPQENGNSGNSAVIIRKSDPRTFTKKDRDEISRRVLRGERIEF